MKEIDLPRAFMGTKLDAEDERVFRLMVLKKYEKLEFIDNVKNFQAVFLDVVRGMGSLAAGVSGSTNHLDYSSPLGLVRCQHSPS